MKTFVHVRKFLQLKKNVVFHYHYYFILLKEWGHNYVTISLIKIQKEINIFLTHLYISQNCLNSNRYECQENVSEEKVLRIKANYKQTTKVDEFFVY
jgi:hypothetical protein